METEKMVQRFNEVAEKYDNQRRLFIPCFDDYYGTSVNFLMTLRDGFRNVLDLGAGTGLLTKFIFSHLPYANYVLVDISDQMLEIAQKRFLGFENVEFIVSDYTKELPNGKFDLISSALSIHHLTDIDKNMLYTNIYDTLEEGGIFINLDQFNASSASMDSQYNKFWYDCINNSGITPQEKESWLKRRELDNENTIEETVKMLKGAGFKSVECIYSYYKFGVIIAEK